MGEMVAVSCSERGLLFAPKNMRMRGDRSQSMGGPIRFFRLAGLLRAELADHPLPRRERLPEGFKI